jgi:hypothetical protein
MTFAIGCFLAWLALRSLGKALQAAGAALEVQAQTVQTLLVIVQELAPEEDAALIVEGELVETNIIPFPDRRRR